MASQRKYEPRLSTAQALLQVLNDVDSDDDNILEEKDLDFDFDLNQLPMPRILKDYGNDEPGFSSPKSRSGTRSSGDLLVICIDLHDVKPHTAKIKIDTSRSRCRCAVIGQHQVTNLL